MKNCEKIAIVDYIEFNLIKYVEELEQHVHPDVVSLMYEDAYKLLSTITDAVHDSALYETLDGVNK